MPLAESSGISPLRYARVEPVRETNSESAYYPITVTLGSSASLIDPSFSMIIAYDYTSAQERRAPTELLQNARQEIQQLAQIAHEENWDGEGASRLATETIELALKLVDTFPSDALGDDLDIDATPFGSIDFGWVLERDVMMNVLVLSSGEIGFAHSVHGERRDGKKLWEGTLPSPISEAFDRVFNQERSDG